jgi:hypothetical protein
VLVATGRVVHGRLTLTPRRRLVRGTYRLRLTIRRVDGTRVEQVSRVRVR